MSSRRAMKVWLGVVPLVQFDGDFFDLVLALRLGNFGDDKDLRANTGVKRVGEEIAGPQGYGGGQKLHGAAAFDEIRDERLAAGASVFVVAQNFLGFPIPTDGLEHIPSGERRTG